MRFSFVRPVRAGCFGFDVLTSGDLTDWVFPGSLGLDFLPTSETVEAVGASHQRVIQTYTIHPDEEQRYYSLQIDRLAAP